MAHAYTPGLKVTPFTIIRKERKLPGKGEVLVSLGERVQAEQIVARTELPGSVEVVKLAQRLGVSPAEIPGLMVKKVGDAVRKGEVLARSPGFFGFFRSEVRSPIDGTLESVSEITGQAILREPPIAVELKAYIPGEVTEIFPETGVEITARAALVQGIFGVGGENFGILKMAVNKPDEVLDESSLDEQHKGCVVVGGSLMTLGAIRKAEQLGVRAVVAGGINDQDLKEYLGYSIGVAITGMENIPLTLIVTEGFGRLPMAPRTFELLKSLENKHASVNGATQIRAGVLRPEIIIPEENPSVADRVLQKSSNLSGELKPGTLIRIIRPPFFGKLARVSSLPVELQKIATESKVRVVEVILEENGQKVVIPRANVELFEE
ncbi:MAG: hypothetical protein V2G48_04545 [bacterium JZ-2024 1]